MTLANNVTKTITFYERHLYPTYKRRLTQGDVKPYEIKFENMDYKTRELYQSLIYKLDYKAIFSYQGKNYLIIYNK